MFLIPYRSNDGDTNIIKCLSRNEIIGEVVRSMETKVLLFWRQIGQKLSRIRCMNWMLVPSSLKSKGDYFGVTVHKI
jgi:hypothetical protein